MASGLLYLLVILHINPAPVAADPSGYLVRFFIRIITAAVANVVVVQIQLIAHSGQVKAAIGAPRDFPGSFRTDRAAQVLGVKATLLFATSLAVSMVNNTPMLHEPV
jgi:hypothetical protein